MQHVPPYTQPNNVPCMHLSKEYNNVQPLEAGLNHQPQDDEIPLVIASQFSAH